MEYYTCPICEGKIEKISDGKLRYCECKCLGIDCTKEYVNFIGCEPRESKSFEEYYNKKKGCY